jgi:hypothetical protein
MQQPGMYDQVPPNGERAVRLRYKITQFSFSFVLWFGHQYFRFGLVWIGLVWFGLA